MCLKKLVCLGAVLGLLALGATGWAQPEKATPAKPPAQDIVETAVAAGSFNTLLSAVKTAGLVETLKGEGPLTVFAPTDKAFEKIPKEKLDALLKDKEKLTSVLTYHVISGKVTGGTLEKTESLKALNGQIVKIGEKDKALMVGEAKVVKADIVCANGVIHVIDTVLQPPDLTDIVATAAAVGKFKKVLQLLKQAELDKTLKGEGPFTVFLPTDEAFASLQKGEIEEMLREKGELGFLLGHHVVAGKKLMAADVMKLESVKALKGSALRISVTGSRVMVNNAEVTQTDIMCSNGVIHEVGAVISLE